MNAFLSGVRLHQARHEGSSSAARWAAEATSLLVANVGPQPGEEILDIASGRGEPGLALAAAGARVTLCDIDAEALRAAEDAAARMGVSVRCQVAGAEALPFAEGTFDKVTCQWGLGHVADAGKVIREAARVLRAHGRAFVLDWGRPEKNGLFDATFALLGSRPPARHAWVDVFGEVFASANAAFHEIRVHWSGGARALFESIASNTPALQAALEASGDRAALEERAISILEHHRTSRGIELPSEIIFVEAERPRRS